MTWDGSHLLCEMHEIETYYCTVLKEWCCVKCELENIN